MNAFGIDSTNISILVDANKDQSITQFQHSRNCIDKTIFNHLNNNQNRKYILKKENKKPYIELEDGQLIGLSLSHSEELSAVIIYPYSEKMGIDIEIKSAQDYPHLLRYILNKDLLALHSLELSDEDKFYLAWTAKEALVKALDRSEEVSFEKLKIKTVEKINSELYQIGFEYFPEYQARTTVNTRHTISIAKCGKF